MKFRKLEWEAHDGDKTVWASEVSVAGDYLVKCVGPEQWEASQRRNILGKLGVFPTSELAKQECQDDLERRIAQYIIV